MDIFDRIVEDHTKQRELMDEILKTSGDSLTRKLLFDEFCKEFKAHAAAEEHAFYAPMLEEQETTDQSRHSVAEHDSALNLIKKLDETPLSSPAWIGYFQALAEENEHHMVEEEEAVFPLVKDTMNASALIGMLEVFDTRKNAEIT